MAQLMPLPLTDSCFSKIQIGFTFLVLPYPGNPEQNPESRKMVVCVCVCVHARARMYLSHQNIQVHVNYSLIITQVSQLLERYSKVIKPPAVDLNS